MPPTQAATDASAAGNAAARLQALQALRTAYPEFGWLGLVDTRGRRTVLSVGSAPPDTVQLARAWADGQSQASVSDASVRAAMQSPPPPATGTPAAPALDLTVPVPGPMPDRLAMPPMLAARVTWSWIERLVGRMQQALSPGRGTELMLAARDGTVLIGPAGWPGRRLVPSADLGERGRYLAGSRTQLRLADGMGLGWTVVVRQRADEALAPVQRTRRTVFLIVAAAGLAAATAAAALTRVLMRRLGALARDAEAVRRGERHALAVPAGRDEVSRIGATLAQVVDHLQAEKRALQTLNAVLDARVVERTARIERLAEESRLAAVTRERLRLARELHDTLAHSLMALLTQIRLIRKLGRRLDAVRLFGDRKSMLGDTLKPRRHATRRQIEIPPEALVERRDIAR